MKLFFSACLILFISFNTYSQGQASAKYSKDKEWSPLIAPVWDISDSDSASKTWGPSSAKFSAWKELFNRQYRERGIDFFNKYPADTRFNEWLLNTCGQDKPAYWKDAMASAENERSYYQNGTPLVPVIDNEAKKNWQSQYLVYRAKYLSDDKVTEDEKKEFKKNELSGEIYELNRSIYLSTGDLGEKLNDASPLLMRYAADAMDQGLLKSLTDLASHDKNLHTNMLSALKLSQDSNARNDALSTEALYKRMREKPVQLKLSVLGNPDKIIDIEKLRGKVVMIDFWNIHCGSCINHMPKFERIYKQFKKSGFELISVCIIGYDGKDKQAAERAKAIEIEKKHGLTYSSLELVPGFNKDGHFLNENDPTWKYFDWPAGGAVFLLDKDGYLVTTDLTGQWQEYEIRRLLGLSVEQTGK